MIKKNRGEYHIHVDAQEIESELEFSLLHQLHFNTTDFSGHPEGALHFETPKHLTYKTQDIQSFRKTFGTILDKLEHSPKSLTGYVEGEYIPIDIDLEEKPYNHNIPVPCRWELDMLPNKIFREDELHITLDKNLSDQRLIENLRSMGFFSAYMEKPYGTAEILTVQGTRKMIKQLLMHILPYLKSAGGAINCSIKEEQIIQWWASSPDIKFPPVAKNILFNLTQS
jgi:hypothetical protein